MSHRVHCSDKFRIRSREMSCSTVRRLRWICLFWCWEWRQFTGTRSRTRALANSQLTVRRRQFIATNEVNAKHVSRLHQTKHKVRRRRHRADEIWFTRPFHTTIVNRSSIVLCVFLHPLQVARRYTLVSERVGFSIECVAVDKHLDHNNRPPTGRQSNRRPLPPSLPHVRPSGSGHRRSDSRDRRWTAMDSPHGLRTTTEHRAVSTDCIFHRTLDNEWQTGRRDTIRWCSRLFETRRRMRCVISSI